MLNSYRGLRMHFDGKHSEGAITKCVLAYAEDKGVDIECHSLALGMSGSDVSDLQQGKRTLTAEEYVMLCDLLEVSPKAFMEAK